MNPKIRYGAFRAIVPALLISPLIATWAVAEEVTPLDEVVVSATRTSQTVDETLAATTIVTRQEIEQLQSTSVVDVLRKYVPGVDFTISGGMGKTTGLHLRGTESDHVLVLIDGVRAGSVTTGAMAWSHLPAAMIERIEIVRGPRSSLYGSEAIGGIISITTRKDKAGSWHGSVSAGSYNTQKLALGTSFGNAKTSASINTSYVNTDGIDAKVTNNPDKDGYDNKNINLRLQHKLTDKTDISLTGFYAEGTNEFDDFGDTNRSSHSEFVQQNLGLNLSSELSERWHTGVVIGEYRDKSKAFDGFPGFFNTTRQQLNWQNDISVGDETLLTLGVDYQRDRVNSSTSYAKTKRTDTGYFAEYQTTVAEHDVQVSLRTDDNDAFGTHTTGNLSVGRDIGKSRLIASYGTAFKAPTLNELYFPFGFGNPDLQPEKSRTLEIGFRTKLGGADVSTSIFRTEVTNLIATDANFQAQNIEKARIDGLELEYNRSIHQFALNTNLTLLNPVNRTNGKQLESRTKRTLKVNLDRDFDKFSVGGSLIAQSKRAKGTYSSEIPGYATVDLHAGYRVNKHIQLQAAVNNLLDKDYQTKSGYNMPDRNVMFTVNYQ